MDDGRDAETKKEQKKKKRDDNIDIGGQKKGRQSTSKFNLILLDMQLLDHFSSQTYLSRGVRGIFRAAAES